MPRNRADFDFNEMNWFPTVFRVLSHLPLQLANCPTDGVNIFVKGVLVSVVGPVWRADVGCG
ncbi:hypothetical protein AGR7A_pTi0102 [Agrobacterium deltaense NCPPB 1641]|uniref:Uncharacterized protein n=1 Tax=Agrobacterium deltaense NCPPB 1641 TaxID=1183425 RepID=A0A1S7UBY9_9HYPH|nr:hypothetical protein AGR7A_pTi0102 [Agrobacterium deltaense NCPPB 1641]